jgi:hypothetical protein
MTQIRTLSPRRAVTLLAVAALAVAVPTGAAQAAAPKPAEHPAIVGPLLQIFTFGADVGIPTGCQAGTAALGSGAAYFGYAQQLGPYIGKVNNGCTTVQVQGDKYIAIGNKQSAALAAWNPYVNPVLQSTADSVTQVGTTYGDALSPFGPTIAGLGGTINFFQGH